MRLVNIVITTNLTPVATESPDMTDLPALYATMGGQIGRCIPPTLELACSKEPLQSVP